MPLNYFSITLFITGSISLLLAIEIWQRKLPISRSLALLTYAVAIWSITDAIQYLNVEISHIVFWTVIGYPASQFSPVLFFLFSMLFTQQEQWLTRKKILLMSFLPATSIIMAATNTWHRYLWPSITISQDWAGRGVIFTHGPWFWVETVYSYIFVLTGIAMIFRFLVVSPARFSLKTRYIMVSSIIPFLGHLIYAFFPQEFAGRDLTPFIFSLSVMLLIWAAFRFQFLDLIPIARATLIEDLQVGFLFLDNNHRIVDINSKARELFDLTESPVGKLAEKVIEVWPELESKLMCSGVDQTVIMLKTRTNNLYLDVHLSSVAGKEGNVVGRVMVFNEISEQKKTQEALSQSEQEKSLILQAMTETVAYYTNQDLTIAWVNQAFAELVHRTVDELQGFHCYQIWHQRSQPCEECPVLNAFANGQDQQMDKEAPDGRVWELRAYPVRNNEGGVTGVVELGHDITDRKHVEERIKHYSFHDALTDLYNRAFFEEELRRLSKSRELPLGIIMADVNGLKLANDAYGHQVGDILLKQVAEVLRRSCRREDLIARWGGDEFIILLSNVNSETMAEIVERIQQNCIDIKNEPIPVSISIGFTLRETAQENIEDLMKTTEERMYRKKLDESRQIRQTILSSLENTLKKIPWENDNHIENLTRLTGLMAQALGLADHERKQLEVLSHFHDLGKITISRSVLDKPTMLTSQEWKTMKKHSEIGYRIAQSSPELAPIADAILAHHEQWDGQGYPQNLEGEKIPLLARILTIVDAYDVMLRGYPYKKPMTRREAGEEIRKKAGTQFDPRLVEVFLSVIDREKDENGQSEL